MSDWAGWDASEAGERRWRSVLERFAVAGVECQPGALEAGLVLELLRPTLQLIRRGAFLIRRCIGQLRNLHVISWGFDPSLQSIVETITSLSFEAPKRQKCGRCVQEGLRALEKAARAMGNTADATLWQGWRTKVLHGIDTS